jgi:hypothetical protein
VGTYLSLCVLYGEDVKKVCCISDWYNHFESGQESPEDKQSGRSATSRSDKYVTIVCTIMMSDRCMLMEQIANIIDILFEPVQNVMK